MALTVQYYTNPELAPVWNPNVIYYRDTDTTNYNLQNYRYYFYVYARTDSTSSYTLAGEYEMYPDSTGACWFDVSRILQNFMVSDFRYNISGFDTVNPKQCVQYYVNVWRKYISGGYEYSQNLGNYPNGYKVFDGALSLNELNSWTTTYQTLKYDRSSGQSATRAFSNVPTNLRLSINDWYTAQCLSFDPVNLTASYVGLLWVYVYQKTGQVKAFYKHRPSNINIAKQFMAVGVGPANLIALGTGMNVSETQGWSGHSGAFPIIDSNTDRYEVYVYLQNTSNVLAMPVINVKLDHIGYRGNDRYWLVYKNKYGAYSWLKFEAKMYKSLNVKKEKYQKIVDKKTMLSTSGKYLRGTTVVGSETTEKYTLNSEYANVSEQGFYEELIASPCVYLLKPTTKSGAAETINDVIPVQIADANYTLLTRDNVNLVQYTIEVDASLPRNIQRS